MRSIGNPEDFSNSLILDYLIADVHIFLGDGGDGGVACDGDAMVEAVGVGGGVVAVAAIASPALAYLCGEGASAYVDACHCLDGLWLALFVVACGGGCEGASAEVYLAGGVDALASIAAACHGEGATRHGEVTVALDACCAAVVVFFLVVHAVAACGDGGGAACDDDNGVGLDASRCIGCDVDADGSVIDP